MRETDLNSSGSSSTLTLDPPLEDKEESKLIPISKIHDLLDQPLQVTIPSSISTTGINEIWTYLRNLYPSMHIPPVEPNPIDFEWIWLTKTGSLPKRLSKYIKRKTGSYPDQKILTAVGNIAMMHSENNTEYYFEITDTIDWTSTQFGQSENGSCWWSGDNSHLSKFCKGGGLGVKFFPANDQRSNSYGIGRLWLSIEPTEKQWAVAFNGYWHGQGATLKLARILASYLGLSYKKAGKIAVDQGWFLNSSLGYVLGEQTVVDRIVDASDTVWIPYAQPMVNCDQCLISIPEKQAKLSPMARYSNSRKNFCSVCYEKLFSKCGSCMNWKVKIDLTEIGDPYSRYSKMSYCPECLAAYTAICGICDARWRSSSLFTVDGISCCGVCRRWRRTCSECKYTKTLNTDSEGNPFCTRCERELEAEISFNGMEIDPIRDVAYFPGDYDDPYNVERRAERQAMLQAQRDAIRDAAENARSVDVYTPNSTGGCDCPSCRTVTVAVPEADIPF